MQLRFCGISLRRGEWLGEGFNPSFNPERCSRTSYGVPMLQLEQIQIENFLSFRECQEVSLAERGLLLIEGENRDEPDSNSNKAGKSAIVEAVVWALYGKTIRGLKHDKVVNRFAGEDCRVSVRFKKAGTGYQVIRHRKHTQFQNQLQLLRGEKHLESRHETATQEKLEEILEMDHLTFANTVTLGGGSPFSLLTDSQQKRLLESFFGFDRITQALETTRKELSTVKSGVSTREHKLLRQTEKAAQLRGELQAERDIGSQQRSELEAKRDSVQEDLRKAKRAEAKLPRTLSTVEGELEKLEPAVHSEARAGRDLEEQIRKLGSLKGAKCPTCGQHVDGEATQIAIDACEERLVKSRRKLKRFKSRLLDLKEEAGKARQINERVWRLDNRLEEVQEEISELSQHTGSDEGKVVSYSAAVRTLLRNRSQLEVLTDQKDCLLFWEKGFGPAGLKALVARKVVPQLNRSLKEVSRRVIGPDCRLQFAASRTLQTGEERDLFHVEYENPTGADSYIGESSGGRRRLDVCIVLCFLSLFRRADLLLVDEFLDGLDAEGQERVLQLLTETYGTVFVISHRRGLKLGTDAGRLLVVKEGGRSQITEEK